MNGSDDCSDGTSFLDTERGKPQWRTMMIALLSEDRSALTGTRLSAPVSINVTDVEIAQVPALPTAEPTQQGPTPIWNRNLSLAETRELNRQIRELAAAAGLDLNREQGFHSYGPDLQARVISSVLLHFPGMSQADARHHVTKAISVYAGEQRRRRKMRIQDARDGGNQGENKLALG
jgi:hypothetical protein